MRRDEHNIIDDRPGRYYVTARNDAGKAIALLGPFDSHLESLEYVTLGRQLAEVIDPRAPWYSYGTCRLHDDQPDLSVIFSRESTRERPVMVR
jgi:hypothetical protein